MSDGPVRVVVDGRALTDGSRDRGFGTTLRHLLPGLAAAPALDLVVLAEPEAALPVGAVPVPLRRHHMRPKLALLEHEARLPRDLRRAHPDVVWSPANQPPRGVAPLVQTIHDLTPLVWPSSETEHDARRWKRSAARVRAAARVAAVSRSSADQAIRLLGVDAARVEVIHNGVDPAYTPGDVDTDVDVPYVLFVGAWGPHKGHAEAFATVAALAEAGYPHLLRVAGPDDAWMRQRVQDVRTRAVRPDRVEVLGFVPDLAALYRGASALVFTSRAEGFGLPILEAMACGTPVVAFANTSTPEIAGEAALLVRDGDVAAMVMAVRRVLDDAACARECREAGLVQAARFRWDDAVTRYVELFVDAAHG